MKSIDIDWTLTNTVHQIKTVSGEANSLEEALSILFKTYSGVKQRQK
jgi:hypothetical protein